MRQPLEIVIERYQKSMYCAAYQICRNADDANDAVQDTFLRYYSSTNDFSDDEHIKAWLLRVVINRTKDLKRSAWRRLFILSREARTAIVPNNDDVGSLFDVIATLPENYRIVIHLHYYDDLSIKQIADILRISEGCAKMRLSRARSLLRDELKPDTAETVYTLGTRTLKNGSKGTDVKAMQEFLLQLEYSLPKYGADGEFGSETEKALKAFQRKIGIKQDGLYGSETHQALMDAVADDDEGKVDNEPETETTDEVKPPVKQVRIVCGSGSVNIRVGNDTKYGRITSVKDGTAFEWIATAENGWHAIVVNAQIGWVSGKYSELT